MLSRPCRTAVAVAALSALVPAVADAAPRALYALSTGTAPTADRTVTAFLVGADGGLTGAGDLATGSDGPRDLAFSPDGRFAYLAFDSSTGGGVRVLRRQADGTLDPVARVAAGSSSTAVAVSPDGRFLYLADVGAAVRTFAIGADGGLTAVGAAVPTTDEVADLAIAPDGRYLYASIGFDSTINGFALGVDGRPSARVATPMPGAFATPAGLTITTEPRRLIVQDASSTSSTALAIAGDGSLGSATALPTGFAGGPVAASPVGPFAVVASTNGSGSLHTFANAATIDEVANLPFGGQLADGGLAVSADGATLYARDNAAHTVRRFSIGPTGALTEGAGAAVHVTNSLYGGLVLAPDQPPVAAFSATPSARSVAFDASATTDQDGTVARYDWDFGDGTTLPDAGPTVTHAFGAYGSYAVTLTTTDDQGCSTTRTFTGASVSCNGGPAAVATRTVALAAPAVAVAPGASGPSAAAEPAAPVVPAPVVSPQLLGRGAGSARATAAGRVTLPELTAVCSAGAGPCDDATVAVDAVIRGRAVTLGKGTFRLADGASAAIVLTLSPQGRRLLARARSLEAQATVLLRNAQTTREARRTTTFRLLAPRRR